MSRTYQFPYYFCKKIIIVIKFFSIIFLSLILMLSILSPSSIFLNTGETQLVSEYMNDEENDEKREKDVEEKDVEEKDGEENENLLIQLYSNTNINFKKQRLFASFFIGICSKPSLEIQLPPPK